MSEQTVERATISREDVVLIRDGLREDQARNIAGANDALDGDPPGGTRYGVRVGLAEGYGVAAGQLDRLLGEDARPVSERS